MTARRRFSGLPAPFAEAEQVPLRVFFKFSEAISPDELSIEARDMAQDFEDMGFEITDRRVRTSTPGENWIRYQLAVTNIGVQRIDDLRNRAIGITGYQDTIISTVKLAEITRFR